MPVVEMKKLSLLAHREEQVKIMEYLQKFGALELTNVQTSPRWETMKSLMEPDQATDQAAPLESRLGEVRYALDFLQRNYPEKKNFIQQFTGTKLNLSFDVFNSYIDRPQEVDEACISCRKAEQRLAQIRNEEVRSGTLLAELSPWGSLDLPLEEIRGSSRARTRLAVVPAEKLDLLQNEIAEKVNGIYFEIISRDKDRIFCFLASLLEDEPVVQEIFKLAGVSETGFPDISGTAEEAIGAVQRRLQCLEDEKAAVKAGAEKLLAHRPLLMAYHDYLQNEVSKREAVTNLARTEAAFYLEGWIPAPAYPELAETLGKQADTAVLVIRNPEPGEDFPILLHNQGPGEPYEAVTRLYGLPSKSDYDPTPLMAPFFFACFGICLGDVGYGVLLSLAAYVLRRKLKLAGMGRQLINLLFWGGISSIIFGVLMGGWFGDLIPIPPLWFNPLDDPMKMLIFSFVIGIIQIYFGMAIKAHQNVKDGKPWDALFDQGGWYLFLTGMILMILLKGPVGKWMAIGGALVLILTQGRSQKNPVRKLLSGILSLYDVTGFLSDVLSYSRLLALGLATGVIASALNTMGGLLAGSIPGFVVMVVLLIGGHIFNLVISTLSSYVHTSRLQYIEFFGKFFAGGGKAFKPFQIQTKFVDVEEREACQECRELC